MQKGPRNEDIEKAREIANIYLPAGPEQAKLISQVAHAMQRTRIEGGFRALQDRAWWHENVQYVGNDLNTTLVDALKKFKEEEGA